MIIQSDFLTHWKVHALSGIIGRAEALTALLALWGHCQNSRTYVFEFTLPMLAGICQYQGNAATLHQAMLDCRLLDPLEDGKYEVHGWAEKNASYVSCWANGAKGGTKKNPSATPNASQGIPSATPNNPMGNPSATHRVPIGPPCEEKEEKEENRKEKKEGTVPAGPAASMIFWDLASGWTGFTPVLRENLTKAFPGIDVDLACMETDRWLRDNPGKAGKKNWLSFLTNWLRRSSPSGDSADDSTSQNHAQKNEDATRPPLHLVRPAPAGPWRAAFTATYSRPADIDWAALPPAIQREIKDILAAADPLQLAAWMALEKNEKRAAV
jgi:hypothetical protein